MKSLENVWSGILQRRLLPVVILLVAALAAIPFVLAKDPEPVVPAAPAADSGVATESNLADPVVELAAAGGEAQPRRRVLGARKNPFEPAAAPKGSKAQTGTTTVTSETAGGAPAAESTPVDGGTKTGGSSESAATPETPSEAAPESQGEKPAPTVELYSLTVRFGSSDSDVLEKRNLPRLKALPSAEDPILVYLGPGEDAKTAIFMVDEGVEAQGDGVCQPTPRDCETIHMRPGDTEFFDVKGEEGSVTEQFQLDVLKIKTSKASASKAAAARAKVSRAGLSVLRARQAGGPLRYRYDAKSGTVRRIPSRKYKALLAKSARVALGTAGGF